ncbi:hypothetical protein BDW42DRAFT_9327 [Aspergillus taichungensis]|uniref:Uncharacterized protein n=1 Tax=Aspergillus taichungensis TaxID=482145 RepID=A0A2J5HIZ2_9EURO|nr:hypothetical protein BDW42DRAFT_9327 [Aspergillus taichungensis]
MGSGRFLGFAWHYIDLVHIFPFPWIFFRVFYPPIFPPFLFLSRSFFRLGSYYLFCSLPPSFFLSIFPFHPLFSPISLHFPLSSDHSIFHTISYCILSSLLLSSIHEPSKFNYLPTSYLRSPHPPLVINLSPPRNLVCGEIPAETESDRTAVLPESSRNTIRNNCICQSNK